MKRWEPAVLLYGQLRVASCCGQWACSWAGVPHRRVDSLDHGAIVGAAPLQHCHPEVVRLVALRTCRGSVERGSACLGTCDTCVRGHLHKRSLSSGVSAP